MDKLFDAITKIIASPHTSITEHDKRRAIQVFLGFDDYLIDALPGYCEEGCEIDFAQPNREKADSCLEYYKSQHPTAEFYGTWDDTND